MYNHCITNQTHEWDEVNIQELWRIETVAQFLYALYRDIPRDFLIFPLKIFILWKRQVAGSALVQLDITRECRKALLLCTNYGINGLALYRQFCRQNYSTEQIGIEGIDARTRVTPFLNKLTAWHIFLSLFSCYACLFFKGFGTLIAAESTWVGTKKLPRNEIENKIIGFSFGSNNKGTKQTHNVCFVPIAWCFRWEQMNVILRIIRVPFFTHRRNYVRIPSHCVTCWCE